MKLRLKILLGALFGLFSFAAHAQSLSPVGLSATPASARPGDGITIAVTMNNSETVQFGPGESANFTIVFTNLVTGASFSVGPELVAPTSGLIGAATVDPQTGQTTPGTGTFSIPTTLPTQTLQAGNYRATVTLNSVTTGTRGTNSFPVSTSVLTVTGKPDLQITDLTYPAGTSYVGGDIIPMTLTYRNNSSTNGTANVPLTPGVAGFPSFVRIQVVLSSNPAFGDADDFQLTIDDITAAAIDDGTSTIDNAGNTVIQADDTLHTYSWNQILPGNYSGSYYVLAKIDTLNQLDQNDPPALTVNGNNIWGGNSLNPSGTLINLLPSNFPTVFLASHVNGSGYSATGYSDNPSMTADGRYVAFASDATNLVDGDTNAARDIFFFDGQTSLVHRVSRSQQGAQANSASNNPAISADGRYVAFESLANNLVVGDTNGFSDIFVVDTLTGLIARVSGANAAGRQANNPSFKPAVSETGRFIVFQSTATNLIPGLAVTFGPSHVYIHDRDVSSSGTFDTAGNTSTRILDVDATAPLTVIGNADAIQPKISADGAWVAFASKASNLVAPATTVGRQHVYVRPVASVGTAPSGTKLVSVATGTAAQGNADSQTPSLSFDGHYLAFASLATNLVVGDTNGVSDIFVYDNTAAAGAPVVRRVSIPDASTGLAQATDPTVAANQRLGSINPTISTDGRYVAYASMCDDLTDGDRNGQHQPLDANGALDIFVHDRQVSGLGAFDVPGNVGTILISQNPFGYQTNALLGVPSTPASNIYPTISADGRFVAFPSDAENTAGLAFGATNLLPLDSNGLRDIFLFDRRTNAGVTPPTPPVVTITSPGSGSAVLVNKPVTVSASATTTVGVVSSVQFFVNGTSLGTSLVFPYSQAWAPTAVGTFTLSALVTDSFGNIGVSANITVTVNAAPSIGITSPGGGTSILVDTVVSVTATAAASNPGAVISQVQFFANGISLGAAYATAPYSATWTPAATGSYALTAVATDSVGTVQTSPAVVVNVIKPGGGAGPVNSIGVPPTVAITAPAFGTRMGINQTALIAANASDADGNITSLEFLVDGNSLGKSRYPYSVAWTPNAVGTYVISAQVIDNDGNRVGSAPIAVTVVDLSVLPPTVAISYPGNSASLAVNTTHTIKTVVTPGSWAIHSVQFFIQGEPDGFGVVVPQFPYETTWTPANLGNYTLTAVITDMGGNRVTSSPVTVTVGGAAGVTVITTPSASVPVGSSVILNADVNVGQAAIKHVQFYDNGAALGLPVTTAYWLLYRPTGIAGTVHNITAQATDNNDTLLPLSAPVTLTVVNAVTPLPTVAINSPRDASKLPIPDYVADSEASVPITVDAFSPSGRITKVELYADGKLLRNALGSVIGVRTEFPYVYEWQPTVVGDYQLVALAYDDKNNVVASVAAPSTVSIAAPPSAAITTPANFGTVLGGSITQASVTANSSNGYPVNVQLFFDDVYVGGTMINSAGAIGTITFTPVPRKVFDSFGNMSILRSKLYVIASDPLGFTNKSVSLSLNVTDGGSSTGTTLVGEPPIVSITRPVADVASPRFAIGTPIPISIAASDPDGNIRQIVISANGQIVTTLSQYPYNTDAWFPTNLGTYAITAKATDNDGNTVTSAPVTVQVVDAGPSATSVTILQPTDGAARIAGTSTLLTATASDDVSVANVQFFLNGQPFGTVITTSPYNLPWTPATPGSYTIVARATDNVGNQATSAPVTVTVNPNAGPAVTLLPLPASTIAGGTAVTLTATATDSDGTVTGVEFLANNIVIGSSTAAPHSITWTPGSAGAYTIIAQATDDSGNVANSAPPVVLTVAANQTPSVRLTAPQNGASVNVNAGTTISASSSDPDGTITRVQIFVNGSAAATLSSEPFRATWTPTTEGVYRLTAVATDNAGASTTSAEVTVLATQVSAATSDTVYIGMYTGGGETGRFAAVNLHGTTATFIAHSTMGPARTHRMAGIPVASGGGFSLSAANGGDKIDGSFSESGASGTFGAPSRTFIGPVTFSSGGSVAAGYYGGSLSGRPTSVLTGIVGLDGSIFLYVRDGTFTDVGSGVVNASGEFLIETGSGNIFAGKADPATRLLAGTLSGAVNASFTGALPSGGSTFSNGFLRNISTRGRVGTGDNILIAGFVVEGSPKQLLIRAAGPAIAPLVGAGVTLADPALQVYTAAGAALPGVASNDWNAADAAVMTAVGATPFAIGSQDAAVVATLDPGVYTVHVRGADGASGIALAEIYDVDSLQPFSSQRMVNISTRGRIGTGDDILIAGFVVNGSTPKKVLIRGVGPSLAFALPAGSALADPILQLLRHVPETGAFALIRENDNWDVGNDAALIREATTQVGASTVFLEGSKDAAILLVLPPGIYTAQMRGVNDTSGLGLVEVYEVQ